jgi:GT2 family glycosyltransferase
VGVTRVATLLTCHNRRERTLAVLDDLSAQVLPSATQVQAYLVDDGSSDGTSDAVRAAHPEVKLLSGDGGLFWNGGMRYAFSEALKVGHDHYLWLNDDTVLDPDALSKLLSTYGGLVDLGKPNSIVVGSLRDKVSGDLTYGGVERTDRLRRLRFQRVQPRDEAQECETMNGNCVLIPHSVVEKIGNMDPAFTHGMADYDYGLRARKAGCSVWVAPGFVGSCSRNPVEGNWDDVTLPLRTRLRKVASPKGLPPGQWGTFAKRYAGPFWPVFWAQPYVRLVGSSLLRKVRDRGQKNKHTLGNDPNAVTGGHQVRYPRKPRIAVVYRTVPQYRKRFYELLKDRLESSGMDFVLIYGQPGTGDAARRDSVDLPWAFKVRNTIFKVRSRELYWQPCLGLLKDCDLVIVEQASKLLVNYVLLVQNLLGTRKLAFWGHGKNFQARGGNRLSELVKRFVSRRVHWWFAYNDLSAGVVRYLGFPGNRITSVQNAIDTRQLAESRAAVGTAELAALKSDLGLTGENVCLYVGGMYAEKNLAFLLEACHLVRERVPDFEMIFVGSGPDKHLVEGAARANDWVHYVGPKFDVEKVPYFMVSKLQLMPGAVGLAVLDSFALELPLITTAARDHGPEIEYLQDGFNGKIVREADDPRTFAATIARLLEDEPSRLKLVQGCQASKDKYTLEEMVERFADGVVKALRS